MADKFQLKALITGVDKLSPVLSGVRKNAAILRKQLNSSGLGKITFGEALQGGAIAAPFVMGVKAAIGFESAMADVKKVVNFETPQQFQAMNKDVLDLSERLPMAAEGIAQIVAAGGQSGIAREELNKFAEDAVKMGVAFDQTAAESGEMMAKWRTAFRMNQTEVVALADKINYLGNTGPANTKQISAIITEVGALGEVAGLTSAQVAAIGATMAGVGVKQDVAATGIKNFMLAMTKGSAATKSQAQAFKSLRLDSKKVAADMQKDSQATMLDLLKRISQVDAAKRPALLTNLFGSESVAAITPLVTNLTLLTGNLTKVADATQYAGSMEAEYTSRAATTANGMQLLQNRVTRLGITVGSVLLPPFNDFMESVGPIITGVTELAGAHPWLIKGLLGAAVGFTVLRLATAAATAALALMNGVASMSPIGLIVRGIALAAGILIANWSTVAPYFARVWAMIKGPAMALWEWMKAAFAWTPLGVIIANWQPLTQFFGALWGLIKAYTVPFLNFLGTMFSYTPLGMIVANWGPVSEFFGALWEVVKSYSVPFLDFLGTMFDWSPLGAIVKNWEPITAFFQGLWDKLKPILAPMMKFLGFDGDVSVDGVLGAATNKVNQWAEQQNARNGAGQPVPGALVKPIAEPVQLMPEATSVASLLRHPWQKPLPMATEASQIAQHAQESLAMGLTPQEAQKRVEASLVARPGQPGLAAAAPASLAATRGSLVQQAGQTSKAQLEGQMVVRFDNAPPGMRVEQAKTNQPGLQVSPQVGYRSLGAAR